MGILSGKVAVITGGTRGLGLGIARAYVLEGALVVLASRSQSSVDAAIREIDQSGNKVVGMAVDVADLKQVEELAAHAIKSFGRLDIWVNNAGISCPYGPTIGSSPEDFIRVVDTNILGVYHGSRTAMKYFLSQGSGKLINVLGHGDSGPVAWQNAYASSKIWVKSFTMSLAKENEGTGVGVYAFNPGLVLTEMLTDVDVIEGSEDRLKAFPTIVRMWANPPAVPAKKAVWIASSATDKKTGMVIKILSPGSMLLGVVKEAIRALKRSAEPEMAISMRRVPYSE